MSIEPVEETTADARPADRPVVAADRFDLVGYQAAITAEPDTVRAAVRSILRGFGPSEDVSGPPAATYNVAPAEGGGWTIDVDGTIVNISDKLETALGFLEWRLVTDALSQRQDLLHVHGGALCLPTRRAGIVLAGDSGSGKTTLTQGLMLRGFTPFGDDVALIDPVSLELQVLRRAFHVTEKTWRLLAPLAGGAIGADQDGPPGYFSPPQWAEHRVPVRWVLFVRYRAGQEPLLVRLPQAEAAAGILSQAVSLASNPRVALPAVARLTSQAACYRFSTGDLAASVDVIQRLVAT